jgi:hypothetical protein
VSYASVGVLAPDCHGRRPGPGARARPSRGPATRLLPTPPDSTVRMGATTECASRLRLSLRARGGCVVPVPATATRSCACPRDRTAHGSTEAPAPGGCDELKNPTIEPATQSASAVHRVVPCRARGGVGRADTIVVLVFYHPPICSDLWARQFSISNQWLHNWLAPLHMMFRKK